MADMKISITLDAAELRRQLGLTEAELKKVDGKQIKVDAATGAANVDKLKDSFAKMALASVAAAVSIGKVIQTVSKSIDLARIQVNAERLLESQLRATGNAAGISAENLKRIAGELQQISNIGDEAIIQNLTVPLTTFRQISGDVFERTQKAILDMNAVLGDPNNPGSLRSMAIQTGKALNDPIKGVTALSRVGVSFSESQKATIANFVETNRLAEAQAVILQELELEFGGAAEATINSSIQMKNAWGDYLESLGKNTLPILDGVNLAFANFFTVMSGNMNAFADNQQNMMVINFRSMNDFAAGLALNSDAVVRLVWGATMAVMGAIDGLFRFSRNSIVGWAKTVWDVVGKLPTAVAEAAGLGNLQPLKDLGSEVKDNFSPALRDAQISLKIIGDQFKQAISGFRDYEKNFSTITDQSLKSYVKTLEIRKSLAGIGEGLGEDVGGSGSTADAKATAAQSEYAKLLAILRQYHTEAEMAMLTASEKELAILTQKQTDEKAIVSVAIASQEIDAIEGYNRLQEIDEIYAEKKMVIIRKSGQEALDEAKKLADAKLAKAVQDENSYFTMMQFADQNYMAWKTKQIKAEINAMDIGEKQKADLIKQRLDELKALKEQSDQAAIAAPGHWFFTGILGFDPDKDVTKIEGVKNAYNSLKNSVSTSISGLMNLSKQRQQQELTAIDEVAKKQNLSDDEIAKRKTAINKKYESEQKRVGNIQKAASIAQTTINTAEAAMAAYKALAGIPIIGPVLGGAASAAAIAAGAIQIAVIKAQKFATGGLFKGKGGETDDQNLVYLSNNEYVVNAAATKRFLPVLNAINFGTNPMPALPQVAYATGGQVSGGIDINRAIDVLGRKLDAVNANIAALELSVNVINKAPSIETTVERHEQAKARQQSLNKEYVYAV